LTGKTVNRNTHKQFAALQILALMSCLLIALPQQALCATPGAKRVDTPYTEQKAVFEFYFDHPEKISSGLYWLLGMFYTLNEEPYGIPPDLLDVKVVLHGAEIVTLAKKNYDKYEKVVERMKYYAEFGVEFKVCANSAHDYGYKAEDFHDFVQIVPNAITEIIHWQMQGYGLVIPQVLEKHHSVEELQ
jgi:intracellular sulfur oxidation DsrE/DsrF family protein